MKLQATINNIDDWAKKLRIKINQSKSTHSTFILHNQTCPTLQMGNVDVPQRNKLKYLDIHLDRRLTWAKHIKTTTTTTTRTKAARPKSETNALATRKITSINRKQTPSIQIIAQTHMDLWNSALEGWGVGTQPPIPT
jgi:hypothetical protein